MDTGRLCDALRTDYARVLAEPEALWAYCHEDVVLRISGAHPLSGCYQGKAAIEKYLAKIRQVPGRNSGFAVTSVLRDEDMGLLLIEGVARNGEPAFVRPMVHVLRLRDALIAQMWDYPFDQRAEDRFWTAHVRAGIPAQRIASSPLPATPTLTGI